MRCRGMVRTVQWAVVGSEHTETMAQRRERFERLAMPAVNALYRQAMKLTNNPEGRPGSGAGHLRARLQGLRLVPTGHELRGVDDHHRTQRLLQPVRKAKRRPQRANDSTGEYDDWDIYSASEHTSEGLKSAEQEYLDTFAPEEIMAALAKLSPERRQVFIDAGHRRQVLPAGGRRAVASRSAR